MWRFRTRRFKAMIGALALLGAIVNVCVLTVHITSVALTSVGADGEGLIICHKNGITLVTDARNDGATPSSKKRCPICSGLATLHLGVMGEAGFHTAVLGSEATAIASIIHARIVDRRLQQILNRGPPHVG
jgi:hypothetical protein